MTLEHYHQLCGANSDHRHQGGTSAKQDPADEFTETCCAAFLRSDKTSIPEVRLPYTALIEAFVMIGEALLFAVLLMYRDSGSYGRFRTFLRTKVHRRRTWPQPQQDEDLVREETHVRSLIASHELPNEVLAVLELSKVQRHAEWHSPNAR